MKCTPCRICEDYGKHMTMQSQRERLCLPLTTVSSFPCLKILESFLEGYHQFSYTASVKFQALHPAAHEYGPGTCHKPQELKD